MKLSPAQFLHLLFPDHDDAAHPIVIWASAKKETSWCATPAEAGAVAEKLSASSDVYFGVALQDKALALAEASARKPGVSERSTRGFAKSAHAIGGIWCDIDIKNEHHAKAGLPASVDIIVRGLMTLPHEPSLIISTGGGVHAWWLFREPWVFEDDKERAKAQAVVAGWQAFIAEISKWTVDPTADLSRVLRPTSTTNHKYQTTVEAIWPRDFDAVRRYNPSDFDTWSRAPKPVPEVAKIGNLVLAVDAQPCDKIGALLAHDSDFNNVWHGHRKFPSQSERDLSLAHRLVAYGCTDQEIVDALICNRRIHGAKDKLDRGELRESYYARTIHTARCAAKTRQIEDGKNEALMSLQATYDDDRREIDALRSNIASTDTQLVMKQGEDGDVPDIIEVAHPVAADAEDALVRKRKEMLGKVNAALGLSFSDGEAEKMQIVRIVRYSGDPGEYQIWMASASRGANVFVPSIDRIANPSSFAALILDATKEVVPILKVGPWREVLKSLMLAIEDIQLPTGTPEQDIADLVTDCLGRFGLPMRQDDSLLDAWHDPEGRVFVLSEALLRHLSSLPPNLQVAKTRRELARKLKQAGGTSKPGWFHERLSGGSSRRACRMVWEVTQIAGRVDIAAQRAPWASQGDEVRQ